MARRAVDINNKLKADALSLETRVGLLEAEIAQIKQTLGIDLGHKDPVAWENWKR